MQIFRENFFQAGEIWILILTIPLIHTKKTYIRYGKICIFQEIHTQIIIVKRNLKLNNLGFLYYSAKAWPDLSGFI